MKLKTANEILLEKRSNLVDGVPREMTGDPSGAPPPIEEAKGSVYWKNVPKDAQVRLSKGGKSYLVQMPDGEKVADWSSNDAKQAQAYLNGLVKKTAKKESADPEEPANLEEASEPGLVQFSQRFVSAGKKLLGGKIDPKFQGLAEVLKKAVAALDKAIDEVL